MSMENFNGVKRNGRPKTPGENAADMGREDERRYQSKMKRKGEGAERTKGEPKERRGENINFSKEEGDN